MKRYLTGFLSAAVLVSGLMPLSASALSVQDVQDQITTLMARISSLTKQIQELQLQASSTIAIFPTIPHRNPQRICNLLNRNLWRGTHGDDVSALQEYLSEQGYFSGAANGYYGPITGRAVASWQNSQGVSAVGIFGPSSRERMKIWCGKGMSVSFDAVPVRGAAPLNVTFSTMLGGKRADAQTSSYSIDFGDNSSADVTPCYAPADKCISPGTNVHTYSATGTYTAILNKITNNCPPGAMCFAGPMTQAMGKIQIHVGTPIAQSSPADDPRCSSWYDGCNSCSRQSPGGPAMCTMMACRIDSMQKPYCRTYFDTTTNRAPTISGFSGPTTLALNQTGTWSVSATDPEGGALSYHITWGDENMLTSAMAPMMNSAFTQLSTFTHTYANAGNYTVAVSVRDSAGLEANTTSTVHVGTTSNPVMCTADAMQCANGTWVGRTGPNCRFMCQ